MNTNISLDNRNVYFGAYVSDNFFKAAHNYYKGVEYNPDKAILFDEKVFQVEDKFGYDEFTINLKKETKDGKRYFSLYAVSDNMKPVLLTSKDKFRKVLDKFMRLTKGELYTKIKQAKIDQGLIEK